MTGFVTANLEARLGVTVQGPSGQIHPTEAVIDTGFDGWLGLPPALVASLSLPFSHRQQGVLADGNPHEFEVFRGTVIWDGQTRNVEIVAIDSQPLVGVRLLRGTDLRIEFVNNGTVTITPRP
jgi:clan AA aspartic protease